MKRGAEGVACMQGYSDYVLVHASRWESPVALEGDAVQDDCSISMAAEDYASQALRFIRCQRRHFATPCAAQGSGFKGSPAFWRLWCEMIQP